MGNTLSALRQELGAVAGSCKAGTTTAGGTNVTILDTTNFTDSYMNSSYYNGRYAVLTSGTYSGQIRRVSSYTGSSGTITVADAYGGAPGTPVTFELHSIDPTDLKNAINRALARMYYWTIAYPTLVADGDMEASGTANWTGSTCTPTKETTIVKYGTQSLKLTNSDVNGYTRTASMSCTPLDNYYLETVVRADNFTVSIQAYDVTNSAQITLTTSTSTGGREWKRLYSTFQVPSGCEQLQIRLVAAENNAVTYWDNLILQKVTQTRLALPSWVTETGNVVEVQYMPYTRTDTNSTSGVTFVDEEKWTPIEPQPFVEQDRTAVNPFWLDFAGGTVGYHSYRVMCVRQYGALSADTDTTMASKDWVVAGGILELLRMGVLRAPGNQEAEFQKQITGWKRDWMRLCRLYQPTVPQRNRSPWDG